jgi:hypothetical protein
MEDWDLQDNSKTTNIGQTIGRRLGEQVGQLFDSFMSIYRELYQKKYSSPSEIQEKFKDGNAPLFTEKQANNIFNKLNSVQTGGGRDSIVNESVQKLIDILAGIDTGGSVDPRIQQTIQSIQAFIRASLPLVFTLNTLEKSPLFGELVGSALDITAASLPIFASISQTQTPVVVGLLPLPYASTVGLVAGWLFSFFFLFTAMLIGLSRKDFSAAVEATAGMIPVLGPVAMRTVSSADRTATKLRNRAEKVYQSIQNVYGKISNAIDTAQKVASGDIPSISPTRFPQTAGTFKTLKRKQRNKRKWTRRSRMSKKH